MSNNATDIKVKIGKQTFTIDSAVFTDDWELVEVMNDEIASDNIEDEEERGKEKLRITVMAAKLIFGKNYPRVKEACRAADGHVSVQKITQAVQEVFAAVPKSQSLHDA